MRLAKRLSELSLGGKVFLCNSGAEAIECAIKLARRHRPGGDFVVLEGGFHGRTMGALSATPQETKQAPFAPLVPGFKAVPREGPPLPLVEAVSDRTAAIIIEPIQGEGGIHPIHPQMLAAARDACEATGALLIFDEIQCGMGRTGALWAWEESGVEPDVMTVAKGLGGGLPIGACVTSPDLRRRAPAGRPRLDLRRRPGGGGRGERGARHRRRRRLPRRGGDEGRAPRRRPAGPRPRGARPRPDARVRVRRRPGAGARAAAGAAAGGERDGPRHRPPAAPAHRERGRDRRSRAEDLALQRA